MKAFRVAALLGIVLAGLALASILLSGCVTATATRTTTVDGVQTVESIEVHSFLMTIKDGNYSTSNGMVLSTSSATPDQESIATLAGIVGDLGKSAMMMATRPTNSVLIETNTSGAIIRKP